MTTDSHQQTLGVMYIPTATELFEAAAAANHLAHRAKEDGRDPSVHFEEKNNCLLLMALLHGAGMRCRKDRKMILITHTEAPGMGCHTIPNLISCSIDQNGYDEQIRAALRKIFGISHSADCSEHKRQEPRKRNVPRHTVSSKH